MSRNLNGLLWTCMSLSLYWRLFRELLEEKRSVFSHALKNECITRQLVWFEVSSGIFTYLNWCLCLLMCKWFIFTKGFGIVSWCSNTICWIVFSNALKSNSMLSWWVIKASLGCTAAELPVCIWQFSRSLLANLSTELSNKCLMTHANEKVNELRSETIHAFWRKMLHKVSWKIRQSCKYLPLVVI